MNKIRNKIRRLFKIRVLILAALFALIIFLLLSWHARSPRPIESIVAQPNNTAVPVEAPAAPDSAYKDFGLVIPAISLDVPVIANVDGGNQDEYLTALQNGVAQFKNTALPGSAGNVFIFGHSSDWRWHPGNYKKVFVRVPELVVGNEIFIWYQQKPYTYKVTETHIVEPTDISWLSPTTENYLTLSTCYPINTSKQRFIVRAKQE